MTFNSSSSSRINKSSSFSSSTVSSSRVTLAAGPSRIAPDKEAIPTANALKVTSKTRSASTYWALGRPPVSHAAQNYHSTNKIAQANETLPSGKSNNCVTITTAVKKREIYQHSLNGQHRSERKRYITRYIACLTKQLWRPIKKSCLRLIQQFRSAMPKTFKVDLLVRVVVQFKISRRLFPFNENL